MGGGVSCFWHVFEGALASHPARSAQHKTSRRFGWGVVVWVGDGVGGECRAGLQMSKLVSISGYSKNPIRRHTFARLSQAGAWTWLSPWGMGMQGLDSPSLAL